MSEDTGSTHLEELILAYKASGRHPNDPASAELFAHLLPMAQRIAHRIAWQTRADPSPYEGGNDFASEAILRFLRNIDTMSDFSRIPSWFTTVITRIAIDRATKMGYQHESPHEALPETPSRLGVPEDVLNFADMLRPLSKEHRDVIICIFGYQLNAPETARYLDIPLGTVKSRTAYALRYLREFLALDELLT